MDQNIIKVFTGKDIPCRSTSGGGSSSGGSSSGGSGSGTAEHKSVPTGYTGQTKVIDRVEVPEYV